MRLREGNLRQLLIGHEFVRGRLQLLFNGSEHFLQVQARYPAEDVLHSGICELGLCSVWQRRGKESHCKSQKLHVSQFHIGLRCCDHNMQEECIYDEVHLKESDYTFIVT